MFWLLRNQLAGEQYTYAVPFSAKIGVLSLVPSQWGWQ